MDSVFEMLEFNELHDVVQALSAALEAKNSCTCGHSERVAEVALLLARQLKLPLSEQKRIHIGAHMHDIGKIGVPDAILDKPGRLTESEFAILKRHPEIGSQILGAACWGQRVIDIVRNHHEHYDGSGYPDRLRGTEISLGARIVAVADAFDAITGPRPYRVARSIQQALEELRRCSGTQFDPTVVDAMMRLMAKGELKVLNDATLTNGINSA